MKLGEHKTVQARILDYAEAIGWTLGAAGSGLEMRHKTSVFSRPDPVAGKASTSAAPISRG